jgi:hypothetical protein
MGVKFMCPLEQAKVELNRLIKDYWDPEQWALPELYFEEVSMGDASISVAGLSSHLSGYGEVSASAVDLTGLSMRRAFFELIERLISISWETQWKFQHKTVRLVQENPFNEKTVSTELIFPSSDTPNRWRYSITNGVAAHTLEKKATLSAGRELVERDRLLRSWYGEILPIGLEVPVDSRIAFLSKSYEIEAYYFGENVIGIFGYPVEADVMPFIMGFGCGNDHLESVDKAIAEMIQRFVFLRTEKIPNREPEFTPTVAYHLDYFLYPPHVGLVRKWLSGETFSKKRTELSDLPVADSLKKQIFADLTPASMTGKISVVKAVSKARLPLIFGHPSWSKVTQSVHPIA